MSLTIQSAPIRMSRPLSAEQLQSAVEGAAAVSRFQQAGIGRAVSIASTLTAPVELWEVGKAGFGGGEVHDALKVVGGAHSALNAYKAVRGLMSKVSPEQINELLKPSNGGKDLDPADAQMLAGKINTRARINSSILMGNAVACGAAIATGNLAAGIVALTLKAATIGSAVITGAQTVRDIQGVLHPPAQQATPQP